VLETGGSAAYSVKNGWLNRMLALLPRDEAKGIAIAATVPMALRGPIEVASYAPSALPDASDDLPGRVAMLYANDPQLHAVWEQATATRMLTSDMAGGDGRNAAATGALTAKLLSAPGGARIAMIETGGWDTHAQQRGRLTAQLRGLDGMAGALKLGFGPLWANTVMLVATEFGRTVKVNGTQGTDHGTGSMAMLLGGAVQSGRVIADWPGLSDAALYGARSQADARSRPADRQCGSRAFRARGTAGDGGIVPWSPQCPRHRRTYARLTFSRRELIAVPQKMRTHVKLRSGLID
jgi:uncharacterized protein (DUF1501 family)